MQCQFQGQEMVLIQIMKEGAESELAVGNLLKAEYRLLGLSDSIKAHFDKWVAQCGIAIPSEQCVTFPFHELIFYCLQSFLLTSQIQSLDALKI